MTPSETSVSMVEAPWRAFSAAARWNGHAAQATTGVVSTSSSQGAAPPSASPIGGTMAISSTGTVSASETSARWRRARSASRSWPSCAPAPAPGVSPPRTDAP